MTWSGVRWFVVPIRVKIPSSAPRNIALSGLLERHIWMKAAERGVMRSFSEGIELHSNW